MKCLPVFRRKIVFNNFYGKGYGDSPKYIAEEIRRQGLDVDMVWLVNDLSMDFPPGIRKVKLQSLKASFELSTAKMIVSNVRATLPYKKKQSQYYIQTWHGSVAFKAIEKDAIDKLRPDYVREAIEDSKMINHRDGTVTVSADWIVRLEEFRIVYESTKKDYEQIKALYESR